MQNQIVGIVIAGSERYIEVMDGVFSVIREKIISFIKKDNPNISDAEFTDIFADRFSWPMLRVTDLTLFKNESRVVSSILFRFNYISLEITVIFQFFIPHIDLDGKPNFMISIETDQRDHDYLPENLKSDLIEGCLFKLSALGDTYYSPDSTDELKKFIR